MDAEIGAKRADRLLKRNQALREKKTSDTMDPVSVFGDRSGKLLRLMFKKAEEADAANAKDAEKLKKRINRLPKG